MEAEDGAELEAFRKRDLVLLEVLWPEVVAFSGGNNAELQVEVCNQLRAEIGFFWFLFWRILLRPRLCLRIDGLIVHQQLGQA